MKEITTEQFELIPESEHKVRFAHIGELVYTLEDIFLGTDTFSDETLEEMVCFFENQERQSTWFLSTKKSTYLQFKPSEIRTDPNIMTIARKCLELIIVSTNKPKTSIASHKRLAVQLLEENAGYILVLTPDESVRELLKECYKLMHSAATRNLPEYSWIDVIPDYGDGIEIYRWTTPFTHQVEKDDSILEDDDIVKNGLELMAIGQGPSVKEMDQCSTKNLYHDDVTILPMFSFVCDKDGFHIKANNTMLTDRVEYPDVFTPKDWTELNTTKEDVITIASEDLIKALANFEHIRMLSGQINADSDNRIEELLEVFELHHNGFNDSLSNPIDTVILYTFGPKGEKELTMAEASQFNDELRTIFGADKVLYSFSLWDKNIIGADILVDC